MAGCYLRHRHARRHAQQGRYTGNKAERRQGQVVAREVEGPGEIGHEPYADREDFPGIAGECRHIGDQGAIAKKRSIRRPRVVGFTIDRGSWQ